MQIRSLTLIFFIVAALTGSAYPVQADTYTDTINLFKKSPEVQPFFANAYGYAIFPTVGKGGIGIGGAYGRAGFIALAR